MWDLVHLDLCSFGRSVKAIGPIRSIYIPVRQVVAFQLAVVVAVVEAAAVAIVLLAVLSVAVIAAGSRFLVCYIVA